MIIPAKKLLSLSAKAYDRHTFKAGGTEVFVSQVRKQTVMAFRGTTFDGADIIKDLRAMPWWSKEIGTFVHRGFLVGVRAIWPLLPLTGHKNPPIVLTGHSKGGAEAILVGAMLTVLEIPVAQIETFGAPRVGFGGIKKILKDIPGKRHRLGDDIVPTVPHRFPLPYRHDRELTEHEAEDENYFSNHKISEYKKAIK